MSKKNVVSDEKTFELKLANGKSGVFKSGYELWRFAVQNNPRMEINFNEKNGPFLSDFFERLRKK